MAGDEATVAKHSLMKQDWPCQDFILPIYITGFDLSQQSSAATANRSFLKVI